MSCRYDVTDILLEHHILPDDVFNAQTPIAIKVEIHAVNGSAVPASSIPAPTIIYEPAHGMSGLSLAHLENVAVYSFDTDVDDVSEKVQAGYESRSMQPFLLQISTFCLASNDSVTYTYKVVPHMICIC